MKTDTKSNSGPLSRAFPALLLATAVAAVCVVPVTGRAQIFVTNVNNSTIGEYNATTGATINTSFISSGLEVPFGIALSGGNLFVTNVGNNTIGEYNATTGATINSSFISGLNGPDGIVVSSPSSVPDATPTFTLLLLGIGATFGLNLLLHRWSQA
jgi:hypothetical protein